MIHTKISKHKGIDKLIDIALNNGDGIYILYADHLNCDAVTVLTIRGREISSKVEMMPGYLSRDISIQFKEYYEDNKDLPVYAFTAGYYTFPSMWKNTNFVKKYIYSEATEIEIQITD